MAELPDNPRDRGRDHHTTQSRDVERIAHPNTIDVTLQADRISIRRSISSESVFQDSNQPIPFSTPSELHQLLGTLSPSFQYTGNIASGNARQQLGHVYNYNVNINQVIIKRIVKRRHSEESFVTARSNAISRCTDEHDLHDAVHIGDEDDAVEVTETSTHVSRASITESNNDTSLLASRDHHDARLETVYEERVIRTSTTVVKSSFLTLLKRQIVATSGEALIKAARKGQVGRVNKILADNKTHVDIGIIQDGRQTTALFAAVENNQTATVATLLSQGANPDLGFNGSHESPLSLAMEMGNPEVFELLLQHGASVDNIQIGRDKTDSEIWWQEDWKDEKFVLTFQHDRYSRHAPMDILATAVARSKPAIVIDLVKRGLVPHKSALLVAITFDNAEVVKNLAAAGADTEAIDSKVGFSRFSWKERWTPLSLAAYSGLLQSLQGLLDAGADIEAKVESGVTALHLAVGRGCVESIKILIANGADVDARNSSNWTPLHYAALQSNVEIFQALINAGADKEAQDITGSTPLHHAASSCRTEVFQALLAAGANVEARDDFGQTPLHMRTGRYDMESMQALLAAGANVEARDDTGETPLHRAADFHCVEIVQVLLTAGANPSVVNKFGRTPHDLALKSKLYYSTESGKQEVLALLKQAMAKDQDDFDA